MSRKQNFAAVQWQILKKTKKLWKLIVEAIWRSFLRRPHCMAWNIWLTIASPFGRSKWIFGKCNSSASKTLNLICNNALLYRSFFLCAFLAAIIVTANLIANVYAKWISTPVIIGISPHPTSILNTPFPAITVCNMNQVMASSVANYTT